MDLGIMDHQMEWVTMVHLPDNNHLEIDMLKAEGLLPLNLNRIMLGSLTAELQAEITNSKFLKALI